MLSNVSGFTQSSGEGPALGHLQTNMPGYGGRSIWEDAREDKDRQGSSGSGSGGSGAGSVGDPKSPIMGNGKAVKW